MVSLMLSSSLRERKINQIKKVYFMINQVSYAQYL